MLRTQTDDFVYLTASVQVRVADKHWTQLSLQQSVQQMTGRWRYSLLSPWWRVNSDGHRLHRQYRLDECALPYPQSSVWAERDRVPLLHCFLHYTSVQPWFTWEQPEDSEYLQYSEYEASLCCERLPVWLKAVKDSRENRMKHPFTEQCFRLPAANNQGSFLSQKQPVSWRQPESVQWKHCTTDQDVNTQNLILHIHRSTHWPANIINL